MEEFTWSSKYSVANKELDHHHRTLFGIFNRLYDSCLNKHDTVNVSAIVEELVTYVEHHFRAEEQYMEQIRYHDIERHISEHRAFAARIVKYRHAAKLNEAAVSKEIVLHLWKWLIDHVMTEDQKYAVRSK